MKIGVLGIDSIVSFQTIYASLSQHALSNGWEMAGLEWNAKNGVNHVSFNDTTLLKWENERRSMLRPVSEEVFMKNQFTFWEQIEKFDLFVVIGGSNRIEDLRSSDLNANVLFVPIFIFNDSVFSLGYDTALNEIVTSIFKIKDTISSLHYMKLRVYCVQLPGQHHTRMLEDVTFAVDGELLTSEENSWKTLKDKLNNKYKEGQTYSFLITNESVNPDVFSKYLNEGIDVDFKWSHYDEAQCLGPKFTATDIILEKKIIVTILQWIKNNLNIRGKK